MYLTKNKYNGMKGKISNLEGQVEALTNQKIEERDKKLREIGNLDDKIIALEKSKRTATNDLDDLKSAKVRSEEDIQHKVKIVMEKHDLELKDEKLELEKEYLTKVEKITAEFRDKREKQLEELSGKMENMYTQVLKHLTDVTGTISQPNKRVAESGNG